MEGGDSSSQEPSCDSTSLQSECVSVCFGVLTEGGTSPSGWV